MNIHRHIPKPNGLIGATCGLPIQWALTAYILSTANTPWQRWAGPSIYAVFHIVVGAMWLRWWYRRRVSNFDCRVSNL